MKLSSISSARKTELLYITAAALFIAAACFGFLSGSSGISLGEIINALKNGAADAGERIFLYIRLPRTLSALFTGAALSLSGAVLQAVLGSRLASPSVLGVNSGAGLAVTLSAVFGLYSGGLLSVFSFAGAFLSILIIVTGSKKWGTSKGTLILMGVGINAFFGAVTDCIVTFFPDTAVISRDFKAGDFSAVTYGRLLPLLIGVSIASALLFAFSKKLDILSLGDEAAKGLGINTKAERIFFLLLSALLAGLSVSVAGLISFVGLIVPHTVRLLGVRSSKHLLPLSFLLGGAFLAFSDTLARTVFSPYEVPVGIFTAFIGAPFFIFMLISRRGTEKNA